MELKDLFDAINAEFGFQEYNITDDGIPFFVVHCEDDREFRHVFDLVEQFPEVDKQFAWHKTFSSGLSNIAVYLRRHGAIRCTSSWKWTVPYADFIRIYNDLDSEVNQPAVFELQPAAVLLSQMQI